MKIFKLLVPTEAQPLLRLLGFRVNYLNSTVALVICYHLGEKTMIAMELQVATDAVQELGGHGFAELQYITAGFEPFSSAQRPDVVFWPDVGPNEGRAFVVELRMPVNAGQELPAPEILEEHRAFFETDPPDRLSFALATSRGIDSTLRSVLSSKGIEVLDKIQSGSELAHRILTWSAIPQLSA